MPGKGQERGRVGEDRKKEGGEERQQRGGETGRGQQGLEQWGQGDGEKGNGGGNGEGETEWDNGECHRIDVIRLGQYLLCDMQV